MGEQERTVSVIHGSQTFSTSSCKVSAFAMKCDGTAGRQFPNKVLPRVQSDTRIPAHAQGFADNGMWYRNVYQHVDGTILLLQVAESYRGRIHANAAVFVRLRSDAPAIVVNVKLQPNAKAHYTDKVPVFTGRGDILKPDKLKAAGIVLRPTYIYNYFDEEEWDELIEVVTIAPGTPEPETIKVKTPDGVEKEVPLKNSIRRRLRIRK